MQTMSHDLARRLTAFDAAQLEHSYRAAWGVHVSGRSTKQAWGEKLQIYRAAFRARGLPLPNPDRNESKRSIRRRVRGELASIADAERRSKQMAQASFEKWVREQ